MSSAEGQRPRVATTDRIFSWVEALTNLGARVPDSPAAIAAAELIRTEFVGMGLSEVHIQKTPTVRWSAHTHSLSIARESIPCSPIFHSFTRGEPCAFRTGPDGLQASVVWLGTGSEADFAASDVAGKIVVCECHFQRIRLQDHDDMLYVHDPAGERGDDYYLNPYNPSGDTFPANFLRAQAAGAVGYVGVLCDYYRERHSYANEALTAYDGRPLTIPGLWVSASAGEAIRASIAAVGGSAEATLVLEGELAPATSRTIIGLLPGRGPKVRETVIVQSHYDSIGPGATQDATGTAAVLALADYFSRVQADQRNRSLLFVLNDTHFSDYAAHEQFIAHDLPGRNAVLAVSVEHIALDLIDTPAGPQLTGEPAYRIIWVTPAEQLVAVVTEAVVDHDLRRVTLMSSEYDPDELGADTHDLWAAGVPVVSHLGVPTYMYDQIDTIDKVDREQLRPTVLAFADILERLETLPSASFGHGRRPGRRESRFSTSWSE